MLLPTVTDVGISYGVVTVATLIGLVALVIALPIAAEPQGLFPYALKVIGEFTIKSHSTWSCNLIIAFRSLLFAAFCVPNIPFWAAKTECPITLIVANPDGETVVETVWKFPEFLGYSTWAFKIVIPAAPPGIWKVTEGSIKSEICELFNSKSKLNGAHIVTSVVGWSTIDNWSSAWLFNNCKVKVSL